MPTRTVAPPVSVTALTYCKCLVLCRPASQVLYKLLTFQLEKQALVLQKQ